MTRLIPLILILILALAAGCTAPPVPQAAPAPLPTRALAPAKAQQPARNPIGVVALSDELEVGPGNPDGFHPSILHGPRATLGQNCVWFIEGAADRAKAYGCDTLIIWTGFGGSRTHGEAGFTLNILDAAQGITLADMNACSAAIHARGLRAGIGISPLMVLQGVNRPRYDAANPVGTLIFEASLAQATGFNDFYVDSLKGRDMVVNPAALPADDFAQVTDLFAWSNFVVEFYDPGYAKSGRVIHWRDSAATFTDDRPQAVELEAPDVPTPAKQAAWGKRLRDTGSTVIVNCRPDDPTLPQRTAPVLAAWKASQGK